MENINQPSFSKEEIAILKTLLSIKKQMQELKTLIAEAKSKSS